MEPFGLMIWPSGGMTWLKYEKSEKQWLGHFDL
jgi:hypothetical protein